MKTLNILLFVIGFSLLTSSCSKEEETNINYEILNQEALTADAGETFTLQIKFTDDKGLDKIIAESTEMGLEYSEDLEDNPTSITREFDMTIPANAPSGGFCLLELEITNISGSFIREAFVIKVN